jgi:hypothetical protein
MISLTAIRNWLDKNPTLRDRVTEECMTGKKKICLAITEGSYMLLSRILLIPDSIRWL